MQLKEISKFRLKNQLISETKFKSVKEIIGWMGAMQAQDFPMSKWALGVRLPGSTEKQIVTAVSRGDILRTHILRPTWHYVLPEDLVWMRQLNPPKLSLSSRDRALGLTADIIKRSKKIIEKALSKGEHLTGDELAAELEANKINTGNYRAWHLFYKAELDGIICSGKIKNGKPTFALLDERISSKNKITREEASALLAKKYFTSHGPAVLQDFIWWSGLPVKDAKNALEMVKSNFISEALGSELYWFADSFSKSKKNENPIYLLPAFDEFVISYKTRSVAFSTGHISKAVSANGIFRPVIVVDGQIKGLWKKKSAKDKISVETEFFQKPSNKIISLLKEKVTAFGNFLGSKTELINNFN